MQKREHEPIGDWSPEGRRRLVEARGPELALMLDMAFTEAVEAGESLADYGFHDDDAVTQAVTWSLERFATADIDPARLHPESRSFRLFTEARFWLSQKVGRQAYARIQDARRHALSGAEASGLAVSDEEDGQPLDELADRLGATLEALGLRTCADLVGHWLLGTRRWRREVGLTTEDDDFDPGGSPKERSVTTADALFRFLCLFADLVPDHSRALADRVVVGSLFAPCTNERPYEVEVGHLLAVFELNSARKLRQLRKRGIEALIGGCLRLHQAETAPELEALLARASLRRTLATRFKVARPDLVAGLKALPHGGGA